METNFFKELAKIQFGGDLQIVIRKTEEAMIVSVLVKSDNCGDKAAKIIPPFVFNTTPDQLDALFFEQLNAPVQKTAEIISGMETYLKAQEEAKKQSALEKDKKEKAKKEKEAQDKLYKEAIKKVNEFKEKQDYYKAFGAIPDSLKFPEYKTEISELKAEISAKMQPDLFGTKPEEKPQEPLPEPATNSGGMFDDFPTSNTDTEF